MEDTSFETDSEKEFECIECDNRIEVGVVQEMPRPITCETCGVEYSVTKNPAGGLNITMKTSSQPELLVEEEKNLEQDR